MKAKFILALMLILTIACSGVASPTAVSVPSAAPSLVAPTTSALPSTATASPTITPSFTLTLAPTVTATLPPTLVPSDTYTPAPTATIAPSPTETTAASPTASQPASVEVDFIDVGQGDAILIQSSDGTTVVIDGGEQGSGELSYLQSKHISRIDLMVATHPHSDHIGGLVDVLNSIPTSEVVTNGQPNPTGIYEKFLDGIANAKAEYVEAKRGDKLQAGNLSFQVLSPVSAASGDINNNSLVLRLVVGKVVFLFTGDAQTDAETSMVAANLPLKADVLKVGHHGSRTSSSTAFLNQVKPSVAVYMAGMNNQYGHPHPETIASLKEIAAQIYGTDVNGSVSITTDGNAYQVATSKAAPKSTEVAATSAPASDPLTLTIASVTSPVKPGATATLTASTAAGASCTITVNYKSGPSKAAGLGPKVAEASGTVSWSWKVGSTTTPGTWGIIVKCSAGGTEMTQETSFTVQK